MEIKNESLILKSAETLLNLSQALFEVDTEFSIKILKMSEDILIKYKSLFDPEDDIDPEIADLITKIKNE